MLINSYAMLRKKKRLKTTESNFGTFNLSAQPASCGLPR
jgi:hypothetical protein